MTPVQSGVVAPSATAISAALPYLSSAYVLGWFCLPLRHAVCHFLGNSIIRLSPRTHIPFMMVARPFSLNLYYIVLNMCISVGCTFIFRSSVAIFMLALLRAFCIFWALQKHSARLFVSTQTSHSEHVDVCVMPNLRR